MQDLYAKICEEYSNLPWPEIDCLCVITNVCGGMGDIAACAKVIMILLEEIPNIEEVNWVVLSNKVDPLSFILPYYHNKITLNKNTEKTKIDFLVDGPAITGWGTGYMQKFFRPQLPKTSWHFKECGHSYPRCNNINDFQTYRRKIKNFALPMGLLPGSGVLINAPLPEGKNSPEWWSIVPKEYSFNFGYAHNPMSKYRFIDVITMHERERNICVVLTSRGEFASTNGNDFISSISDLDDIGIMTVMEKSANGFDVYNKTINTGKRHLLIILFERFSHDEMIFFLRNADRCLVTGNNSAIECWKLIDSDNQLFIYEDVKNCGVTHRFLDQQIQISDNILGKFLRMSNEKTINRESYRDLLQNHNISQSVKEFVAKVKNEYDFTPFMLSSLKRYFYANTEKEYEKFF